MSDVANDNKTTFQEGVLQLYPGQLTADNGMRTLGAWAWGASRVMIFLQKDAKIAKDKVAVISHSRGVKAALWAAPRTSVLLLRVQMNREPGPSLARRQFGETVARTNTQFPHWFTTNYKK